MKTRHFYTLIVLLGLLFALFLGIFLGHNRVFLSLSLLFPAKKTSPVVVQSPPPGAPHAETEQTVTPPLPYFPPPTSGLTGAQLGRQRVPSIPDTLDVYNIYFHNPTQTLFMAVIEHDGVRSVWRLTEQGNSERVFVANTAKGEIRINGTSDGVIYVQHDNPFVMYRSEDGLRTWERVLENHGGMFWSLADDKNGTVYGTLHSYNNPFLYRSIDNGKTWELWKDFHKIFPEYAAQYDPADPRFMMRHLHDIIVNETTGLIIVGTGDVARFAIQSWDNGETWHKVWTEGFTANVRMSGGNRYLLGPDRLHAHGIAVYDIASGTVREVFKPRLHNYAGYVYSILNVDGRYYAALHTEANEVDSIKPKFGIIVSKDGETWYPFLEWGPLARHARTNIWLAGAPGVIYASVNGVLYAFRPVDNFWFFDKKPFVEIKE